MTSGYKMQIADRELSREDALEILEAGEYCVISTVDGDGAPYGVPLSYVMMDGCLYLHTGKRPGHKIDDWQRDPCVSVSVVTEVEACYEDDFFTTRFASVIAQGRISLVEDPILMKKALVALCMKYLPQFKAEIGEAIRRELDVTDVWVVDFDEIRGKGARRLKKA